MLTQFLIDEFFGNFEEENSGHILKFFRLFFRKCEFNILNGILNFHFDSLERPIKFFELSNLKKLSIFYLKCVNEFGGN